eukprot:scaffold7278_cov155-Skeletonema_menzelii.AAC.6
MRYDKAYGLCALEEWGYDFCFWEMGAKLMLQPEVGQLWGQGGQGGRDAARGVFCLNVRKMADEIKDVGIWHQVFDLKALSKSGDKLSIWQEEASIGPIQSRPRYLVGKFEYGMETLLVAHHKVGHDA